MSEWQPIETAPRDGTRVILGWDSGEPTRYGHYLDNCMRPVPWKGWRGASLEPGFPNKPPTHWMPLPDPPK